MAKPKPRLDAASLRAAMIQARTLETPATPIPDPIQALEAIRAERERAPHGWLARLHRAIFRAPRGESPEAVERRLSAAVAGARWIESDYAPAERPAGRAGRFEADPGSGHRGPPPSPPTDPIDGPLDGPPPPPR